MRQPRTVLGWRPRRRCSWARRLVLEATGHGEALSDLSPECAIDSISVQLCAFDAAAGPPRACNYSDGFANGYPNDRQVTVRVGRYKLVRSYDYDAEGQVINTEELYELTTRYASGDPETDDLLHHRRLRPREAQALSALRADLEAARASAGL